MKKIKDSIMMPPPKSRTKSIFSDTSEELRRNLQATDTLTNISDNSAFLEDINKLIKENNEENTYFTKRDHNFYNNHFSYGIRNSPANNRLSSTSINNLNNLTTLNNQNSCSNLNTIFLDKDLQSYNSEDLEPKSSFKFNLTNYNYSGSNDNVNNNIVSQKCLERLKKNLSTNISAFSSDIMESKQSTNYVSHVSHMKPFLILAKPQSNLEIRYFVDNMLIYMKDNEFDGHNSLTFLKIKLQTRYNDYKNKGLRSCYFKESLIKMQKELISKIYQYCGNNANFENGKYLVQPKKSRAKSFSDSSSRKSSDASENHRLSDDDEAKISDCSTIMLKRKRNNNEELSASMLEKLDKNQNNMK